MDTTAVVAGRTTHVAEGTSTVGTALLAVLAVTQVLVASGGPTGAPAATDVSPCCDAAAGAASPVDPFPPVVVTSSGDDRGPGPDATADHPGGIAARIRTTDGNPVPGEVFLLMATAGSVAPARLYDETPYRHDRGVAPEAQGSNVAAVGLVETITGADVELLELTTAPGGGPSGGIAYTIAYLDVVSDGAFTGDLRVAATGRLGTQGYVDPVNAIDEKTAAAHLAGVDVLFAASTPGDDQVDLYGARSVGERHRARHTGATLADERRLDEYRAWGARRPDAMDIVHVRHVADVAAYLCGAGSDDACHVTGLLERTTTEFATGPTRPASARRSAAEPPGRLR